MTLLNLIYMEQLKNEIIAVHKQYDDYYAKGKEMQLKLQYVLQSDPFNSVIKFVKLSNEHDYLEFIMFGQEFYIYPKIAFAENGRLTDGLLVTYIRLRFENYASDTPKHQLYSVSFDKIGNINNVFTIDDFSVPYLINMVAAFKKWVSSTTGSFMLRGN